MNVALRRRAMSQEEFLTWAENQEGRYEFDGFQPVAMTGGTNNHGVISGNIYFALRRRLSGGSCRPMTSDAGGVATVGGKVRYPDATVTCSPIPGAARLIPDPVVIVEVASVSSARDDHADKRIEYQALPSVVRYVVVEQARRETTTYMRDDDGLLRKLEPAPADVLDMPEIGISIPVAEIYEDIVFPD